MHIRGILAALPLLLTTTAIAAEELNLLCNMEMGPGPNFQAYYMSVTIDDTTAGTLTGQILENGTTHDINEASLDNQRLAIWFGDGNIFAVGRFSLDAIVNVGGAIRPLPEDHTPNLHVGNCEVAERQF